MTATPATLRFRPPAGHAEPVETYEPLPADPDLIPEMALWNAVSAAVRELGQFADRIEGGQRRAGEDFRVGPADLARARRVFNQGIEALGRYQHRRRMGGAS